MLKKRWNYFISCGLNLESNNLLLTQLIYVNTFSVVGISFFFIFGMIHLFYGKHYLGILEIIIACAGVLNIYFLKKTLNYKTAGSTILFVMLIALIGFLLDGGYQNTGIFWFYTFPLLAFFLKGKKLGFYWVVVLYILTIFLTM